MLGRLKHPSLFLYRCNNSVIKSTNYHIVDFSWRKCVRGNLANVDETAKHAAAVARWLVSTNMFSLLSDGMAVRKAIAVFVEMLLYSNQRIDDRL